MEWVTFEVTTVSVVGELPQFHHLMRTGFRFLDSVPAISTKKKLELPR